MSEHVSERDLVLHAMGDADEVEVLTVHLRSCAPCRARLEEVRRLLTVTRGPEVPEPDAGFEARVWERVRADLGPQLRRHATGPGGNGPPGLRAALVAWLTPRRLALVGSVVALASIAFVAGLLLPPPAGSPLAPAPPEGSVRERILLVSVGDHLERSQTVLVELVNAEADGPVDVSSQQQRARTLLVDNRLYRQSAELGGNALVAELLDELERVLLEVAHGPDRLPAEDLDWLRERITSRDLLFRVRVVEETVRREKTVPAASGSIG